MADIEDKVIPTYEDFGMDNLMRSTAGRVSSGYMSQADTDVNFESIGQDKIKVNDNGQIVTIKSYVDNQVGVLVSDISNMMNSVGSKANVTSFRFRNNNGAGSRSVTTNNSWVEVPGWSNNTIIPTSDGFISGQFLMMAISNGLDSQMCLYVNGVSKLTDFGCSYVHQAGVWNIHTIPFEFPVAAGKPYKLSVWWRISGGGNLTVCNNNTDQQFPTEISGIIVSK